MRDWTFNSLSQGHLRILPLFSNFFSFFFYFFYALSFLSSFFFLWVHLKTLVVRGYVFLRFSFLPCFPSCVWFQSFQDARQLTDLLPNDRKLNAFDCHNVLQGIESVGDSSTGCLAAGVAFHCQVGFVLREIVDLSFLEESYYKNNYGRFFDA